MSNKSFIRMSYWTHGIKLSGLPRHLSGLYYHSRNSPLTLSSVVSFLSFWPPSLSHPPPVLLFNFLVPSELVPAVTTNHPRLGGLEAHPSQLWRGQSLRSRCQKVHVWQEPTSRFVHDCLFTGAEGVREFSGTPHIRALTPFLRPPHF